MRRNTSASSLSTSGAVAPPTAASMPSSSTQSIHSTGNGSVKSNKSATLAYLTSYESMVRSQDDECDKTHAFLGEAVKRLQLLGGPAKKNSRDVVNDANTATNIEASVNVNDVSQQGGMLTYREMRRALLRLGYTWNRSSSITSSSSSYYDDDDIVSLASQTSKSSHVSGTSGRVLGGKQRKRKDVVATDNQLIMLLSILVEMEEHWRCTEMSSDNGDDDVCTRGLFLPELMQAYKLVIGGMQSLQSLQRDNNDSNNSTEGDDGVHDYYLDKELSERIRERTKRLLRSFGPNHKLSLDPSSLLASLHSSSKSKSGKSRDGLTSPPSSPSKQLFSSPNNINNNRTRKQHSQSSPRLLAEDSLRQLMYTKDATLAKIVEENQYEMEALSHDLEHWKQVEMNVRDALIQKRRRTRYILASCVVVLLTGMGIWEHRRRVWVHRQITLGREEERFKSIQEITRLTQQRDALQQELDIAEGTARYQHSRLTELEVGTNRTIEEIALLEQRMWLGQAEMGRCRVSTKDMEGEILSVQDAIHELEEESSWCSNRLRGRDAELNSLRYSKDNVDDVDGSNNNRGLSLASFGGTATTPTSSSSTEEQINNVDKPVKLEMKYNTSVRNAMMLRQVYSGVGGIAASVVLRAAFPQVFASISLSTGISSKKAVAAATTAPKKIGFNVKWVDRVHAATVVLLVVRTAVLFFLP